MNLKEQLENRVKGWLPQGSIETGSRLIVGRRIMYFCFLVGMGGSEAVLFTAYFLDSYREAQKFFISQAIIVPSYVVTVMISYLLSKRYGNRLFGSPSQRREERLTRGWLPKEHSSPKTPAQMELRPNQQQRPIKQRTDKTGWFLVFLSALFFFLASFNSILTFPRGDYIFPNWTTISMITGASLVLVFVLYQIAGKKAQS